MDPKIHDFPGYVAETYFSPATQGLSEEEKGKLLGRMDKSISAQVDSLASKILQSKPKTEEKEVDWLDMSFTEENCTGLPQPSAPLISYLIPQKIFNITFHNHEGAVLARTTIRQKE